MTSCTVVIPCHNRHDLVVAAVASAVRIAIVTEVIVVDDSSSPPLRVEIFAHPKVRVIANGNARGAQGARVTGATAASGEFILFLDSDDVLHPEGVARLHERLASDRDLAMVYGDVERGGSRTNFLRLGGDGIRTILKNLSLCPFSGLMVRKEAVRWELLDLTLPAWQDDDFALTVARHGRVAFVDTVTAVMAISPDAISASPVKQLAGLQALLRKWEPDIVSHFGKRRMFLWRVRQLALRCLVIAEALRQRDRVVLSFVFRVAARAIRFAVRPFFDRVYV